MSAEHRLRRKVRQLPPRWKQTQQRMDAKMLAARTEVRRRPERVREHDDATFGPPQRDLLPPATSPDPAELEGRDGLLGNGEMRHAEALRQSRAIAVVPVEQLEHSRGRARCPDPLLHPYAVHWIDHPDTSVRHECVRATQHELVDDPPEAAVELVTEPDSQRFHIAAQRSNPGKSFLRATSISSSTSKGTRRNSTASDGRSTTAYSLHGSKGSGSGGSLCAWTTPMLPTQSQSVWPNRRSHCR